MPCQQDQKYKEGCALLQASQLALVKESDLDADCHEMQHTSNMVTVRC